MSDSKESLKRLVRGIVLAQGNAFIKELLRRKKIRIGSTKSDFERNMLTAIEEDKLQREDVDQWLDEVEGWGDQHIYIYKVPQSVVTDQMWSNADTVQSKVSRAGLGSLWNARTSLQFPKKQKLTGIYFDGSSLRFVWHQGFDSWVRNKERDYQEEIEGDLYEFRAYRERAERSVMRFELRPSSRIAAVFMQIPWESQSHQDALKEVKATVSKVIDFNQLTEFKVSLAIKKLDAESLNVQGPNATVKAQAARLSGGGAYVEFASTSGEHGYQDFEPVRQVRRALRPERFTGMNGIFYVSATQGSELKRDIKIQLYGEERRIRLWVQMTAQEVWEVLHLLRPHG